MSKEAMKLALEALECTEYPQDHYDAITALREAREKQTLHELAAGSLNDGLSLDDWAKISCVNHDCEKCNSQQSAAKPFLWAATVNVDYLCDRDDFGRNFRTERCEGFEIPIYTTPQAQPAQQEPVAWTWDTKSQHDGFLDAHFQFSKPESSSRIMNLRPLCECHQPAQPAREPLTDALEALFTNIDHAISSGAWNVQTGSQTWEIIQEAKATHNIKEKNT